MIISILDSYSKTLGTLLGCISKIKIFIINFKNRNYILSSFLVTTYFSQLHCTCVVYHDTDIIPPFLCEQRYVQWPIIFWRIKVDEKIKDDLFMKSINLGCKVRNFILLLVYYKL